jgi:hypothetical protein
MSSITFNPASCRLAFLAILSFLKIWMRTVIKLGQTERKSLLRVMVESRIRRILMQNKMRMRRAGEGLSCFMTSFKDYNTVLSLPSYLSILPE